MIHRFVLYHKSGALAIKEIGPPAGSIVIFGKIKNIFLCEHMLINERAFQQALKKAQLKELQQLRKEHQSKNIPGFFLDEKTGRARLASERPCVILQTNAPGNRKHRGKEVGSMMWLETLTVLFIHNYFSNVGYRDIVPECIIVTKENHHAQQR